jgi:hypothetical protein
MAASVRQVSGRVDALAVNCRSKGSQLNKRLIPKLVGVAALDKALTTLEAAEGS